MKRLALFLIACAFPVFLSGQSFVTGSVTSSGASCAVNAINITNCIILATPAQASTATITIGGTYSATLQFEVSPDYGQTWVSAVAGAVPAASTSVSSVTTVGVWQLNSSGFSHVRVRASAYTSGTALVSVNSGLGGINAPLVIGTTDPCQNSSIAKSSAFANITTATTTALVPVSGATVVYVCGLVLNMTGTTTPDTVIFQQGTGAACSGSPVALTSTFSSGVLTQGGTSVTYGSGSTIFKTAASNGLCALTTIATTPTIAVQITYVQQ